jgi:hypothetical protein
MLPPRCSSLHFFGLLCQASWGTSNANTVAFLMFLANEIAMQPLRFENI